MKNKYIIILSLVFGLLTGYFIYDYLIKVEQKVSNIQYGQVVVAKTDVSAKSLITGEMLEIKNVPVEYIHPQALRQKEEALGSIAVAPIIQGEQVLKKKIAVPKDVKYGLAYAVPPGKRAMTVPVDEVSGIAGLVKPGDRVDVAAVVNIPEPGLQKESPYALVVLQDLLVLATGRTLEDKTDNKGGQSYTTVTLAVTVEQSQPLFLASQKGNIKLMLRSPVDDSKNPTRPFKAEHFLQ